MEEKLSLVIPPFCGLTADFTWQTWKKRQKEGKKQNLVKACKPAPGREIIDVSAGWGRDAAILASFGANVCMVERHPLMAVLLRDALKHQCVSDRQRLSLTLIEADSIQYLQDLQNWPDVIYMDPMHPNRQKSALVKKDLQALQQLIGPDTDALSLLLWAKKRVKDRVVVKWPAQLPPLAPPDFSIKGQTVRFDCYLVEKN